MKNKNFITIFLSKSEPSSPDTTSTPISGNTLSVHDHIVWFQVR